MQNDISNKVRLLLNELAILNQPDIIEGKYFFHSETLKKVKDLSAELYLSSDLLLHHFQPALTQIQPEAPVAEKVVEEVKMQESEISQIDPIPSAPIPAILEPEQELPLQVIEQPIIELESTELVIPDLETPTPSVEVVERMEPIEVTPPKIEPPATTNSNVFDGKISLTRRFEYVNHLFAANGNDFAAFLDRISASPNLDAAMGIFDAEYETRNWKRKAEAASDLKTLIKKNKL
jgi:hypothetical protein